MNTSPSVEMTVGVVSPVGITMVSDPMIMMPPDDMTVCPVESVEVTTPAGEVVVGLLVSVELGKNVNTSPSVVIIVGAVMPVGALNVFDPIMITPPEDITVCPAVSVDVTANAGVVVVGLLVVVGLGKNVNVSPSVVIVVGAVRPVGTCIVSEPMMITLPDDITVWPEESVEIMVPGPEKPVRMNYDIGFISKNISGVRA